MNSYLRSPVVDIAVGTGADQVTLNAHEAILIKSPWFAEKCAAFTGTKVNT